MQIKIEEKLKDDLYAQYSGIYLSDEEVKVSCAGVYGGRAELTLRKGDKIRIDTECVLRPLEGEVSCAGIFNLYAKNINQGVLLTITNLLK